MVNIWAGYGRCGEHLGWIWGMWGASGLDMRDVGNIWAGYGGCGEHLGWIWWMWGTSGLNVGQLGRHMVNTWSACGVCGMDMANQQMSPTLLRGAKSYGARIQRQIGDTWCLDSYQILC